MRILHVGKFFPPVAGGIEYFLADLLTAQQALGIEAAALVHHQGPGWRFRTAEVAVATPLIYRAPCLGRLFYVPLSPAFPLWLDRAIRDFVPDLLHLHLPNTSAFAALLLPRARCLPWVVHWHADVVASAIDRRLALAYHLYRPLEQRLLRQAYAIIATSPPYLAASQALRPWRDRCVTIPLGLDRARLPPPSPARLPQAEGRWEGGGTRLRLLCLGRLTYYKGQEVLIEAAARLPGVQVIIVGDGEQRARLARQIARGGLEDRVHLAGYVPDAEVAALLASCDLLCLPSLERTEAFGLVLLEAMRFAKPVVVSDIPGSGAPWLVNQAGNGRLVAPGDPADLSRAIAELGGNRHRRKALGVAGSRAFEREFSIGPIALAINRLYSQVLERKE